LASITSGALVAGVYGCTEAEPISVVRFDDLGEGDWRLVANGFGLPVGSPVRGLQVRILRDSWGAPLQSMTEDSFRAITLNSGQVGEIVVSGEHVLEGYLEAQAAETTKIRAGGCVWHRTGDLGYLDERGRLWLMGRCSAKLVDSFGEIFPYAIEATLSESPAIFRAAVVASGKGRVLFIQPRGEWTDAKRADIDRVVRAARIDEVRLMEVFPMDRRHGAKIDYESLRALAGISL
jgi:acyl-CoA synthetase (AMP-forming)/AMP-acid ligase II